MKKENNKFYLIMEPFDRPGDYMIVDISLLDLNINNYIDNNSLADLDKFTSNFNKNLLIESVKNSNTVLEKYLNGDIYIAEIEKGNKKYLHKYPVVTNEVLKDIDIVSYVHFNIKNKNVMNTIKNIYAKLVCGMKQYNL